ncbi:hypothetical protein C8R43DRAFT_183079 [Mycena crocata]|nr:hypothetical protein C8R43DRAFT_183079 [Mycena crocata]
MSGARHRSLDNEAAGNEEATAKLWSVYIAEAEKYDKGLVESWKRDMEGLLIFAGLFSASLTAFIIESYKTLTPDRTDQTVQLLAQISQQFSAAVNGTTLIMPSSTPFVPSRSSLLCNICWFLSLGLSLASALIATLVEQWARDFIHKADMRSAPIIRARAYSFLYYGLKRFRMHNVVEVIPVLLHASVILFFSGLVAFLLPLHPAIISVAAGILSIVIAIYTFITVLPLIHLDSPYRTPLSSVLWSLRENVLALSCRRGRTSQVVATASSAKSKNTSFPLLSHNSHPKSPEAPSGTMIDSMFYKAMQSSDDRQERDQRALIWTVKSLTDDTELEPLIEAIPDVLWAPHARRYTNDDHIRVLVARSDVGLLDRISTLYLSCNNGLLTPDTSRRRMISCYKALWAIGTLSTPNTPLNQHFPGLLFPTDPHDEEIRHYQVSVEAITAWANFCTAFKEMGDEHFPPSCMDRLAAHIQRMPQRPSGEQEMNELFAEASLHALMQYYGSAILASAPYQFYRTEQVLSPPKVARPSEVLRNSVLGYLPSILRRIDQRCATSDPREVDWLHGVINNVMAYCDPGDEPMWLPVELFAYVNGLNDSQQVNLFSTFSPGAWKCVEQSINYGPSTSHFPHYFPPTLSSSSRLSFPDAGDHADESQTSDRWEEALGFLRKLLWWQCTRGFHEIDVAILEGILTTVSHGVSNPETPAIIALGRYQILQQIFGNSTIETWVVKFWHPVLPTDTAIDASEEQVAIQESRAFFAQHVRARYPHPPWIEDRWNEGSLHITTQFVESCSSSKFNLPSFTYEILRTFGSFLPLMAVHPSQQLRFAVAIQNFFSIHMHDIDPNTVRALHAILCFRCFKVYSATVSRPTGDRITHFVQTRSPFAARVMTTGELVAWLDNSEARQIMNGVFVTYLGQLVSAEFPRLFARLEGIISQLDALHSERIPVGEAEDGAEDLNLNIGVMNPGCFPIFADDQLQSRPSAAYSP